MPLFLDVEPGDAVRIGADTVVRVERKSGQRTRLRIDSEYKIELDRAAAEPARPDPPIRRPNIPRR